MKNITTTRSKKLKFLLSSKYYYNIAIIISFVLMILGCDNLNKKGTSSSVMTQAEYNDYVKEHHQNEIAVSCSFKPTIEITDYIKNTSLEDIIIQNPGNINNYRSTSSGLYDGAYKFAPANSNLAKAYYLQDFNGFMHSNSSYYHKVMSKYYDEQRLKREKEAQQEWDKYLK